MHGRGATTNPANRFETTSRHDDWEQIESDPEQSETHRTVRTEFLSDQTQRLITSNNSPDIPFDYSSNPYRGCEHGCSYCYARPGHEYLGMNAGIDFESKILVKHGAPQLLRKELAAPKWQGDPLALSGVTDCYQPIERKLQITRACLEVMLEARQPVWIVTKNALVARDIDLLSEMAKHRLVQVRISITTLKSDLARRMEPRTSTPAAKLRAVETLSAADVPVGVMVAPIIPGLTDDEIPATLQAAAAAGAMSAGYTMLRLPLAVEPIFLDWLQTALPDLAGRVESRIRSVRGGAISDSAWRRRLTGSGPYAEVIRQTFQTFARKLGLGDSLPPLDSTGFRPPASPSGERWLFDV